MMTEEEDVAESSIDTRLNDLILFCSAFPPGYEFTKDILVWQWIAVFGQEEEEIIISFQTLLNMDFIVSSRYDYFVDQIKYTISDKMITFLRNKLQISDDFEHYLSLTTFNEFDITKHYNNLQCLIIHDFHEADYIIPPEIFSSELQHTLKILNLRGTNISQLPNSVGNLKELRFLDMSETPIALFPDSISCCSNLQTINLDGCLQLNEFPACMIKLTNMQHLVLDIARQLHSIPVGIGNLSKLQTLSAFLVGNNNGGCSIGELKNMNELKGAIRLLNLENVASKEEGAEARLHDKVGLKKLEFQWSSTTHDHDHDQEHEEILESLQPPSTIQELKIMFYRGGLLPSWITNPELFSVLNTIILYKCRYFYDFPSLGELPSLKCLSIVENKEVVEIKGSLRHVTVYVAFPKLETLSFRSMSKLEKWTGLEEGDFPSLRHLIIESCPKFVGLPMLSRLSSLSRLELRRCSELSTLPDGGLPTTLESWMIKECPKLKDRF